MAKKSDQIDGDDSSPGSLTPIDNKLFGEFPIGVEARLGSKTMSISDLMNLSEEDVVVLDTGLADHVDLYVNNALIAKGEIVAVGGKYGIRVTEIAPAK